jgi:hypothetical protein
MGILICFLSELRAAIPVVIAEISPEEDINSLPAYEDAWKSAPYDPQQIAALIARGDLPPSLAISAPNEAACVANTTLSSSDTEDELDPLTQPNTPTSANFFNTSFHNLNSNNSTTNNNNTAAANDTLGALPWQGIDLSRVPSYTTAIRSNRLYSFSGSLPGYDSVVAVPGRSG